MGVNNNKEFTENKNRVACYSQRSSPLPQAALSGIFLLFIYLFCFPILIFFSRANEYKRGFKTLIPCFRLVLVYNVDWFSGPYSIALFVAFGRPLSYTKIM